MMPRKIQSFLWFDVSRIQSDHDAIVYQESELRDHLQLIHSGFDLLGILVKVHQSNDDETLSLLRLAIRVFNGSGAAMSLARDGFFQQSFSVIRDLIEIEFLADLFSRDRQNLTSWLSLDDRSRMREFKPVRVREKLDALDGYKARKRQKEYDLFSQHAAHPGPHGFRVISPNNMTQIGPFVSKEVLTAVFQELAKHLTMAVSHLLSSLQPAEPEVLSQMKTFRANLSDWRARYLPITPSPPS